jgi:predicted PurR-regulated permease PerM
LLERTRCLLLGLLGARAQAYLVAVGETARAVLYGLVPPALLLGALAGVGYGFAGVATPIPPGVVTAVLALIPFGTPIIWGAVSLWLFLTGDPWAALGLALWREWLVEHAVPDPASSRSPA